MPVVNLINNITVNVDVQKVDVKKPDGALTIGVSIGVISAALITMIAL